MHFDQLKKYSKLSKDFSGQIKQNIENISDNISKKLDKISSN